MSNIEQIASIEIEESDWLKLGKPETIKCIDNIVYVIYKS